MIKSMANAFSHQLKRRQISVRSILLFTIVAISCVAIVSSISFIHATRGMAEMYEQMCRLSLDQVSNSFNIILQNIIDISRTLYEDDIDDGNSRTRNEIYELLGHDVFKEFESRFLLQSRIDRILYTNRYIHSVYLYSDRQGFIGTSDYGFFKIDDFRDTEFLEWYNTETRNIALLDTHRVPDLTDDDGSYHLFSVCVRLPFGTTIGESYGALVINLDHYRIYNEVINKLSFADDIRIYIADSEGRVILSERNSDLYEHITSVPVLRKASKPWELSFLDGEANLVVAKRDPVRAWHYYATYPFTEAASLSIAIGRIIVVTAILTCVFCVVLLGFLVFRQLKPVDEITNLFREKSGSPVSGHILERVRESVYRTYHNNDELRKRLEVSWPLIREQFLFELVMGKVGNKAEIQRKMRQFSLSVPEEHLFLIVVHLDDVQRVLAERELDDSVMRFGIRETIESAIEDEQCSGFFVQTADEDVTIVIDRTDKSTSSLLVFMKGLQARLRERLDLTVTMAVSDEETTVWDLAGTFEKVMEALKYNMLFGNGEIIHYNDIKREGNGTFEFPEKENELLKSYLRIGDRRRAGELVTRLLSIPEHYESYFHAQFFLLRLNLTFIEIMNELHVEIDSVLGSDASIESMLKIRTAREREQFYHGMVDAIARSIEAEHEEKKSRYYRRIRSYLDENYPSDITLETASEEIGLSPSYINRILKQSEHHTFIEALNIERVRRAKEHLTSDGAQIKEVAYLVGFSSSNYFIKIFKELTGVTPGKYQRNARQESTVRVS